MKELQDALKRLLMNMDATYFTSLAESLTQGKSQRGEELKPGQVIATPYACCLSLPGPAKDNCQDAFSRGVHEPAQGEGDPRSAQRPQQDGQRDVDKSESYCMMHVLPDQLMTFGGTSEPCAVVRLISIGRLGVELNKKHAAKIFAFMDKHLGISNDRMFMVFQDLDSSTVGYKGTTFHELYGR
ncbi:hypothetical protein O3P69_003376 [Scylla paramamosain]|uniref:L-dopachrome isomerase n=1 Tax=Scylla paramamosain TaxID=85552 RepID=A0AAW0UGD9_SCYPA